MYLGQQNTVCLGGRLALSLQVMPQVDYWEIPASEVIMETRLGKGAFGDVYKGVVKCPIVNPKARPSIKRSICTHVAIKLLKRNILKLALAIANYKMLHVI